MADEKQEPIDDEIELFDCEEEPDFSRIFSTEPGSFAHWHKLESCIVEEFFKISKKEFLHWEKVKALLNED